MLFSAERAAFPDRRCNFTLSGLGLDDGLKGLLREGIAIVKQELTGVSLLVFGCWYVIDELELAVE